MVKRGSAGRKNNAAGEWACRLFGVALGGAAVILVVSSLSTHGRAQEPVRTQSQPPAPPPEALSPPLPTTEIPNAPEQAAQTGWQRSLTKALTYQTIVVSTDQLLYWTIVTGTAATELEFFLANAATGVGYYVLFDKVWTAAGLDPAPGTNEVSVSKALAYRAFDTVRAFGVTLAVGTPLAASLEVTAAIAATRTLIYMLHDYAWSWVDTARPPATGSGAATVSSTPARL